MLGGGGLLGFKFKAHQYSTFGHSTRSILLYRFLRPSSPFEFIYQRDCIESRPTPRLEEEFRHMYTAVLAQCWRKSYAPLFLPSLKVLLITSTRSTRAPFYFHFYSNVCSTCSHLHYHHLWPSGYAQRRRFRYTQKILDMGES